MLYVLHATVTTKLGIYTGYLTPAVEDRSTIENELTRYRLAIPKDIVSLVFTSDQAETAGADIIIPGDVLNESITMLEIFEQK
jgi:hypothetical protein